MHNVEAERYGSKPPDLQLHDILLHHTYYFFPIFPALRKGTWRTKGLYIQTIKDTVTDTRERNAYNKAKRYDKIPLHGVKAQKGGTLSKNNGRAMLAPTS